MVESEPVILTSNRVVYLDAKRYEPTVFRFNVIEKSKITIEVWDLDIDNRYTHVDMLVVADSANDDNL